MPHMDGFELSNEIKSINPLIKIIIISAQIVSKKDIVANLKTGIEIDEFIDKPVSLNKLHNVVKSVLGKT